MSTWQPYPPTPEPLPTVPVVPVRPQVPLPFRQVGVKYTPTGGTEVVWAMHRWFGDPLPHTFTLQQGRSPQSDDAVWTAVGLPAEDTDRLVDEERRNWARSRDVWYRVVLDTPLGRYPSTPIQPGAMLSFREWRLSREIIRKEQLRHRQYSGVPCLYLKRKRYGPTCPRCTDPGTRETVTDRCSRCYNTNIDRGYFTPRADVFCTIGLAATREQTDDQQAGTTRPEQLEACRLIGDPLPDSLDVIVDLRGGRRFYVHTIHRAAEIGGYTVVVEMDLRPADFSDVIYDFPLGT